MDMKVRVVGWTVVAAMLFAPEALFAQQQSATIRGVVVGSDGRAFAGARVSLLDQLGFPDRAYVILETRSAAST